MANRCAGLNGGWTAIGWGYMCGMAWAAARAHSYASALKRGSSRGEQQRSCPRPLSGLAPPAQISSSSLSCAASACLCAASDASMRWRMRDRRAPSRSSRRFSSSRFCNDGRRKPVQALRELSALQQLLRDHRCNSGTHGGRSGGGRPASQPIACSRAAAAGQAPRPRLLSPTHSRPLAAGAHPQLGPELGVEARLLVLRQPLCAAVLVVREAGHLRSGATGAGGRAGWLGNRRAAPWCAKARASSHTRRSRTATAQHPAAVTTSRPASPQRPPGHPSAR